MTEEELKEWRTNPLTKSVFKMIRKEKIDLNNQALSTVSSEPMVVFAAHKFNEGCQDALDWILMLGKEDEE